MVARLQVRVSQPWTATTWSLSSWASLLLMVVVVVAEARTVACAIPIRRDDVCSISSAQANNL